MPESALSIVLEFARTDSPDDPYACQFGRQEYTLRTLSGGQSRVETESRVELDWSEAFLEDLQDLGEPRVDPASVQRIGRGLHAFLGPASWARTSRAIVDAVRESRPVYLTIRSRAAELYSLPWELVTLEGTGQCVGEIPGLLVRYEWPDTTTTPAAAFAKGRIVVAWSAAAGPVPSDKQIAAIEAAARDAGFDFDGERDVVEHATVGRLADAIDEGVRTGRPVVALHILCHGGSVSDVYGLVLDGESRDSEVVVDAWRLRQLLAPYGSTLRLVVLAACDSANASGLFDSAALALHRAGIHTVLASRFLFSVLGSVSLTKTLYRELLVARCSVEDAFLRARRALARDAAKLDWASMQLYARGSDGDQTFPFDPAAGEPEAAAAATGEVALPDSQQAILDSIDFDRLEMPDLVVLRTRAREELQSRFERTMAIMVIDLGLSAVQLVRAAPGSAGSLMQRFCRLVEPCIAGNQGRIYTTGNTRVDICFPGVQDALDAAIALAQACVSYNYEAQRDELIVPRIGLHYGSVLTDGDRVVGEAAHAAASIAESSPGNVLWMSHEAMVHTSTLVRANCRSLAATEVISAGKRLDLFAMPLGEHEVVPAWVIIENTGEKLPLPDQDIISFGRLDKLPDGAAANDICLTLPDRDAQLVISRWHFELRRHPKGGYVVRVVSGQRTEVNGKEIDRNAETPVTADTHIRLVGKVKLRLEGSASESSTRIEMTRYEQ